MNKLAIKLIQMYKRGTSSSPKRCKYMPTCSSYGLECYQKFSFIYASWLTFYRIIRCNPISKGGYNPPPKSIIEKYFERLEQILKTFKK